MNPFRSPADVPAGDNNANHRGDQGVATAEVQAPEPARDEPAPGRSPGVVVPDMRREVVRVEQRTADPLPDLPPSNVRCPEMLGVIQCALVSDHVGLHKLPGLAWESRPRTSEAPLTGAQLAEKHGFKPHGRDPLTGGVLPRPNEAEPEGSSTSALLETVDRLRRALGLREGKNSPDGVVNAAISRLVLDRPNEAEPAASCPDGTDPDEPADRGFVCVHQAERDAARNELAQLINCVEGRNATHACGGDWETCWCDTCEARRKAGGFEDFEILEYVKPAADLRTETPVLESECWDCGEKATMPPYCWTCLGREQKSFEEKGRQAGIEACILRLGRGGTRNGLHLTPREMLEELRGGEAKVKP